MHFSCCARLTALLCSRDSTRACARACSCSMLWDTRMAVPGTALQLMQHTQSCGLSPCQSSLQLLRRPLRVCRALRCCCSHRSILQRAEGGSSVCAGGGQHRAAPRTQGASPPRCCWSCWRGCEPPAPAPCAAAPGAALPPVGPAQPPALPSPSSPSLPTAAASSARPWPPGRAMLSPSPPIITSLGDLAVLTFSSAISRSSSALSGRLQPGRRARASCRARSARARMSSPQRDGARVGMGTWLRDTCTAACSARSCRMASRRAPSSDPWVLCGQG